MPGKTLRSVGEALREAAAARPEHVALVYLDFDGETVQSELTTTVLLRRASSMARRILEACSPGDRAAVLCMPGAAMPVAVYGAFLAGVTAVPLQPPDPNNIAGTLPRMIGVLRDSEASVVVAQRIFFDGLSGVIASSGLSVRWIVIEDEGATGESPLPNVARDSIAVLMYTSGSTGSPKGVMLSHNNLLCGFENAINHKLVPEFSTRVSWLPPYHISGLFQTIATVNPSHLATLVQLHPLTFLGKPSTWIRAISRHRAALSGAPNMALDLACQVADNELQDVDLSSWRCAVTGSEDNRVTSMDRFARRFGPYGFDRRAFSAAYGMTEVPLVISYNRRQQGTTVLRLARRALEEGRVRVEDAPNAIELVANGEVAPDTEVIIVDPNTRRPVASGHVGEIWVRSPRVAAGYWNRAEETEAQFAARLADGTGPYFRTGDLGFLHHGELFITGRLKQIIIVRGKNIYPSDIELAAQSVEPALAVHAGACFAMEGPEGEGVALLQEVASIDARASGELLERIRRRIVRDHAVQPVFLALVSAGTLPRTLSRKVSRGAAREAVARGSLSLLASWKLGESNTAAATPPTSDVRGWFIDRVASLAGATPESIDPERTVLELGLDSLGVVRLISAVEAAFDVAMPRAVEFAGERLCELIARVETAAEGASSIREDLEADAEPNVEFSSTSVSGEVSQIVLTGSTRFLGSFLLAKLLQNTDARLHVLIRAEDRAMAMARLGQALARYGLPAAGLDSRVTPWIGDVSRPKLGLGDPEFAELSDRVDAIYHSAAILNFVYRYADLKTANVEGTREVLRLASRRGAHVHHFSTVGVFPFKRPKDAPPFAEEDVPPFAGLATGYAKSKWAAEQMVRAAGRQGLPVTIYRIGEVIGHSQSGIARTEDDLFALLVRAMYRMGALVSGLGLGHLVVPVDYVVNGVLALSKRAESRGRTFHLTAPLGGVDSGGLRAALGGSLRELAPADWMSEFRTSVGTTAPYSSLMPFIEAALGAEANLQVESVETRSVLEALGVTFPDPARTLAAYVGYLNAAGYFRSA